MSTTDTNQPLTKRPGLIWVVSAGLLLVMIGTLLPLLMLGSDIYKYVYTAGAALVLLGRMFMPYQGANLRVKRLLRIEVFSGLFFCVGAFLMFYHGMGVGPRDWIAFTLAGGALQIYTSIMLPRASRRKE